jgi:hypothetical protein
MSAGGVLLAEPEGPWHLTWPDTVQKLGSDLINGYFRSRGNPDAEPDDEDDEYPGFRTPAQAPPGPGAKPASPVAMGIPPWLLLAAVAGFFLLRR